jgi:hypothetical protein
LEVGDKQLEMALDNGLAECVAPHDLPKALAPNRHLPTAMGRDPDLTVDKGGDLRDGEVPPTPLRNACEIRRGRPEG